MYINYFVMLQVQAVHELMLYGLARQRSEFDHKCISPMTYGTRPGKIEKQLPIHANITEEPVILSQGLDGLLWTDAVQMPSMTTLKTDATHTGIQCN